jgi:hypothetical protein
MKKLNEFYKWFKDLGGDINRIDINDIDVRINNPILQMSSFKQNPETTKTKYNHKFETKCT